jgi:peptidyl-prolyl cis-trans isomerase A (cyclophilin A)
MFKRFLVLAGLALPTLGLAQDAAPATTTPVAVPPAVAAPAAGPRVALHTNLGDIVLELDPAKAPVSVENFLQYVRDGHYNGTIFHRVIDNFMAQGGGFTADLQQKPTRAPIKNEANNGLSNLRGTVAMARTSDPHSAAAQFFINVVDNPRLDFVSEQNGFTWGYTVFGKVVEGMETVDKIRAVETGPQGPFARDVPKTAVVIENAEILPASAPAAAAPAAQPAPAQPASGG